MPYTVKGKCVYKKEDGSKVGCTKGSVEKYLGALHANTNESVEKPSIFEETIYRLPNIEELNEVNDFDLTSEELIRGLSYTIVGRGIMDSVKKDRIIESISKLIDLYPDNQNYKLAMENAKGIKTKFMKKEENKLKGGKADKLTLQDIANKFNVSLLIIKNQLKKGLEVEIEHTNDKEKAREIVMDHLSEFPDYYDRLKKMEKSADKEFKNENTKFLIKKLIRESFNTDIFTEEYFKQRVPFLKEYNFFSRKNGIQAQKVSFHENVRKMYGEEIVNFPQFNVSSEFVYYKQVINETNFHNFILKNSFHIMQPKNMDDLNFRVFNAAMRQVENKYSYSYETSDITEEELNKIINSLNEILFKIENFSGENNTSLF